MLGPPVSYLLGLPVVIDVPFETLGQHRGATAANLQNLTYGLLRCRLGVRGAQSICRPAVPRPY